jgi:hypothetical protein
VPFDRRQCAFYLSGALHNNELDRSAASKYRPNPGFGAQIVSQCIEVTVEGSVQVGTRLRASAKTYFQPVVHDFTKVETPDSRRPLDNGWNAPAAEMLSPKCNAEAWKKRDILFLGGAG